MEITSPGTSSSAEADGPIELRGLQPVRVTKPSAVKGDADVCKGLFECAHLRLGDKKTAKPLNLTDVTIQVHALQGDFCTFPCGWRPK